MREYTCKTRNRTWVRRYTTAQWEAHKRRQRERYANFTKEQREAYQRQNQESRKLRGR